MSELVICWTENKAKWIGGDSENAPLCVPDQEQVLDEFGGVSVPFEAGIAITQPAYEFPLPEGGDPATHNYGRCWIRRRFTDYQLARLAGLMDGEIRRVHLTRPTMPPADYYGGEEWPFAEEEEI